MSQVTCAGSHASACDGAPSGPLPGWGRGSGRPLRRDRAGVAARPPAPACPSARCRVWGGRPSRLARRGVRGRAPVGRGGRSAEPSRSGLRGSRGLPPGGSRAEPWPVSYGVRYNRLYLTEDWGPALAHLAHYKRSGAAPMLAHYERRAELERGYSRENIDASRTAENYAIGACGRGWIARSGSTSGRPAGPSAGTRTSSATGW